MREDCIQVLMLRDRLLFPSQKPQITERGMFGILVLSGLCSLASSLQPRQVYFVSESKTWLEALHYCREKYTDLATINDIDDLRELRHLMKHHTEFAFIGLYRGWSWSLSDTDDYRQGEPAYWNWAGGQPAGQNCGNMGPTGEWSTTSCTTKLDFFCYNSSTTDISQRFTLVKDSKDWGDAQVYCRKQHTDLARVRNQLDNDELQRIANNRSVWIGIKRKSWMWSDGSEPSFKPWKPHHPHKSGLGHCGMFDISRSPSGIKDVDCNERKPFLCYGGPLRTHLVRLKLTADGSSVDMKDPAVMESVLKWVKKKLGDEGASGDVKLSWWKPPEKEQKQGQPKPEEVVCVK